MVRTSPLRIYLMFLILLIPWVSQRSECHWSPVMEEKDQTLEDLMNRTATREKKGSKKIMCSFASGMWYALMRTDLPKSLINPVSPYPGKFWQTFHITQFWKPLSPCTFVLTFWTHFTLCFECCQPYNWAKNTENGISLCHLFPHKKVTKYLRKSKWTYCIALDNSCLL